MEGRALATEAEAEAPEACLMLATEALPTVVLVRTAVARLQVVAGRNGRRGSRSARHFVTLSVEIARLRNVWFASTAPMRNSNRPA
jgi:hypothetical protein